MRIEVHGHRGARSRFPENTIEGFEYAIGVGVDAIELDVHVSRDGVVVVVHDPDVNGTLIRGSMFAEIRRRDPRIPAFDEVLALAPGGDFLFNIELKSYPGRPELAPSPKEFVGMVWDLVERRRLGARTIIQSFDERAVVAMKKLSGEPRLAILFETDRDFVEAAQSSGAGGVGPEHHLVTLEKVRRAHDAGIRVVPWTANHPADWARLIAAGVDGIITDDPEALIASMRSSGLR